MMTSPSVRSMESDFDQTVYLLHVRMRRIGMYTLSMSLPDKSRREHRKILMGELTSLGRQFGEVCLFSRYTRENVSQIVVYEGFENYERAYNRGKGVLFLTAHLGGWELSAFTHSLHGHPLHIVMRPLDNLRLDRLIREYRTMHGNTTVEKDDFVRRYPDQWLWVHRRWKTRPEGEPPLY